jgi:hypothetical protein
MPEKTSPDRASYNMCRIDLLEHRIKQLEEKLAPSTPEPEKSYGGIDEYSMHELLDRAHLVCEFLCNTLHEHKDFERLPTSIQSLVNDSADMLYRAYSSIGELHIVGEDTLAEQEAGE